MDRFRTVTRLEGLVLPEAPRWHKGRLFFSDLFARRIAAFDPARSAAETIVQLDFAPSGLGWRPDGTLLFVAMNERRLCALVDGRVEIVADLASHCVGPANDMVIAADGSAFISGFGFDALAGDAPQPTALVHVDARGAVRTEGQGLMFPNGLAIVDDGRTLIVAETYGQVLTAFSIAAAGGLSEKRAFARFDAMIAPDGVTAGRRRRHLVCGRAQQPVPAGRRHWCDHGGSGRA